ncbi:hypothetical protein FI667_g5508, partial [Globisporangium splendens]
MAPCIRSTMALALLSAVAVHAQHKVLYPEPFYLVDGDEAQSAPVAHLEEQGIKTSADVSDFMKQKGYANLRAMLDDQKLYSVNPDALDECGYTDPKVESQPIPVTNSFISTGYIFNGPCEVWLDDLKVMSDKNCHTKYPGTNFVVDYSSCKGSCMLRWYWLGIQPVNETYSWQVYKVCVSLLGDGVQSSETPAPPIEAPTPTTEAPGKGKAAKSDWGWLELLWS